MEREGSTKYHLSASGSRAPSVTARCHCGHGTAEVPPPLRANRDGKGTLGQLW